MPGPAHDDDPPRPRLADGPQDLPHVRLAARLVLALRRRRTTPRPVTVLAQHRHRLGDRVEPTALAAVLDDVVPPALGSS